MVVCKISCVGYYLMAGIDHPVLLDGKLEGFDDKGKGFLNYIYRQ